MNATQNIDSILSKAIERLEALKGKIAVGGHEYTLSAQVETFRAIDDMTPVIQEIASDLLVGFLAEASSWSGSLMTGMDEKFLRGTIIDGVVEAISLDRDFAYDLEQEEAA